MFRVVGFLEYGAALNHLDPLVASASQVELAAINAILADRPEFAVYPQVAPRLQRVPSTLVPAAGTSAARRGLEWVLALARAELGGIAATFGNHRAPFAAVRPTQFEKEAYKTLLMDGAQTHYWALVNDQEVAQVARSVPDTKMLAYIRRLNAVRHFLHAGANGSLPELKPPQIAEILVQDKQLNTLRQNFTETVSDYLAAMNARSTSAMTSSRDSVAACAAQLRGEAAELQAGTATVQSFNK